jgi:A/G-specific adenine glycosylase
MAEVMLHRTQARQVVPVYQRFVGCYPDIQMLARATKRQLHGALDPLGLRWRIDLIHEMAKELMARFGGEIPEEKEELLSLPGVGDYIASAVRCLAWNHAEPLVDTNTVRVIGRLFGLETKDSSRRNRLFRDLISRLVDARRSRAYNYALLDLADLLCHKEREPECGQCPAQSWCVNGQPKR